MTLPKKTDKQLIAEIKRTWDSALVDAKNSLNKAIRTGELLIELKKNTPHGKWETVLNDAFDASFGRRHAAKLMKIASQKELLKIASDGDILTINEALQVISDATPEQLEKVEQLKREAEEKAAQAEAEKKRKAAELEAKRAEEETLSKVQTKEPEIIEGEFKEVSEEKPKESAEDVKPGFVQVEAEHLEELQDRYHETISVNESLTKEINSIVKVF